MSLSVTLKPASAHYHLVTPELIKHFKDVEKWLAKCREDFDSRYSINKPSNAVLQDFAPIKTIGVGSFCRVWLTQHQPTQTYIALKIMSKRIVDKLKQVQHTLNEKKILYSCSHVNIVKLLYHFKDTGSLYFGFEFLGGGELFTHLFENYKFNEGVARFYAAQVILAFEYLHYMDIMYRDLKTENLLMGVDGYIKLVDFGFAKRVKTRTYTLCGTPEYLAPEIIEAKPYCRAIDWWAVGILIFELVAGYPPYSDIDPLKVFEMILQGVTHYPPSFSLELRDICTRLNQMDPTRRLGNLKGGIHDIKTHRWFHNFPWVAVLTKSFKAPIIPERPEGPTDTTNFAQIRDDPIMIAHKATFEEEFKDF